MCGAPRTRPAPLPAVLADALREAKPPGRRRIWEIPDGYVCSVVGTCLPHERGVKILRKTGALPRGRRSDYALHGALVQASKVEGPAARLVQKALERAHATSVARYGALTDEREVREAWQEDQARGAVAGAYWAIMSLPWASPELTAEVFGDVHMLSHRVGRDRRGRLRRFDELRDRAQALEVELGEARRAREAAERERGTVEAQLAEARAEAAAWRARAEARSSDAWRALEAARDAEARARARTERRLEHALETLEGLREAAGVARQAAECRGEALAEGPRAAGARPAEARDPEHDAVAPCAGCDLRGATVLYVGGERGMLPELRRLAAAARSELLFHDGGREDGLGQLPRLCARADAIVCPVDRVGHVAMGEVKKACRAAKKTFVPLRRASLDAFGRGLAAIAAEAPS